MDVQGHQIAVGDDPMDGGPRLGIVAEEAFEIAVEGRRAVRDARIMLDVAVADIEPRRLGRLMLVEGQVVEGGDDAGVGLLLRGAAAGGGGLLGGGGRGGQGGRRQPEGGDGGDQRLFIGRSPQ
jgi:hypothetical protein